MALDAGKEVSAGSGVDTEQWSIPQTIEEAIEQVTYYPFIVNSASFLFLFFKSGKDESTVI